LISACTSGIQRVPSSNARIVTTGRGTVSTASVRPEGSRRQITSRPSTTAGTASTGRSRGAPRASGMPGAEHEVEAPEDQDAGEEHHRADRLAEEEPRAGDPDQRDPERGGPGGGGADPREADVPERVRDSHREEPQVGLVPCGDRFTAS